MFVQTLKLILYINVWFIHILRRQTAFLFHTDAIIERSSSGVILLEPNVNFTPAAFAF